MRRHAEKHNILLLAKILEIDRAVALIAINNKQLIPTYSRALCIGIKVLELGKTKPIICLAIRTNFRNLVSRQIFKLDVNKHLANKDNKG